LGVLRVLCRNVVRAAVSWKIGIIGSAVLLAESKRL
jgi:hypothetical protein